MTTTIGIAVGVGGGVLLFAALAAVCVLLRRRAQKKKYALTSANSLELEMNGSGQGSAYGSEAFSGFGKYRIPYKKLVLSKKLGEGNFGEGLK